MIPFDFDYYQPRSINEAVALFQDLSNEGKQPAYFSGGTEIITLGRINYFYTDAVIDIKQIPECHSLDFENDKLVLGAAIPLAKIEESEFFPLLTKNTKEIADHTTRTKVTLGGNICGNIFYREAVLPFLLTNSQVVIANKEGLKSMPINDVFQERLQLNEGDFLLQLKTEKDYLHANHRTIKKRRQWETGYPLITVSAIQVNQSLRIAVSGLCPFPFRAEEMETPLNNRDLSVEQRVNVALQYVPKPILNDTEGSAEYRMFVLKNTLLDIVTSMEGENI